MFHGFETSPAAFKASAYKQFELKLVLERLLEKARSVGGAPYRLEPFTSTRAALHEVAIELIDVPQSR